MAFLARCEAFLFNPAKRTKPIAVILIICMTFLAAISQNLFKYASITGDSFFSFLLQPLFYVGVGIYGFCYVLYLLSLKYGEMSVLMPFLELTFIFSLIFSSLYLGELITVHKIVGLCFIFLGIIFIGFSVRKDVVGGPLEY